MDQFANRQLDRVTFTHYHKPLAVFQFPTNTITTFKTMYFRLHLYESAQITKLDIPAPQAILNVILNGTLTL